MSAKQWKPDKDATHVYVQSCQISSHLSKEQRFLKRKGTTVSPKTYMVQIAQSL